MRDGSYDADDAIPGFVGLDEGRAGGRGGSRGQARARRNGDDADEADRRDGAWSTVDFSKELASSSATPKPASWHVASNGRIVILAPSKAGEYLLEMTVTWQTECLEGDGTVYGRVAVS